MPRLLRDVHRRDPLLSGVGWLHVGLTLVLLVALAIDGRTVLGISPWTALVFSFAAVYALATGLLLAQALAGRPVLAV